MSSLELMAGCATLPSKTSAYRCLCCLREAAAGYTSLGAKLSLRTDQNFTLNNIVFKISDLHFYTSASAYQLYNTQVCKEVEKRMKRIVRK